MKHLITILLFTLNCSLFTVFAQPHAIKYQAVARNAEGEPVAEQQISIKLSLHSTSPTGTVVYAELHHPTTNEYGLINLEIGRGEIINSSFETIDWLATDYFLQTEIDITGGDNFKDLGTTQLVSVPYALSAGQARNSLHSKTSDYADTSAIADGVVLKAPDGTPFKLTVDNNGNLTTDFDSPQTVTDADGNIYKTVKIGNQIWMAENLNVGVAIDKSTGSSSYNVVQTDNGIVEKYCHYTGGQGSCDENGGVYDIFEALNYDITKMQGICPDGWHIPSKEEWAELTDYLGGGQEAVEKMIVGGSSGLNINLYLQLPIHGTEISNIAYFLISADSQMGFTYRLTIHQRPSYTGFGIGNQGTVSHEGSIRCIKNK